MWHCDAIAQERQDKSVIAGFCEYLCNGMPTVKKTRGLQKTTVVGLKGSIQKAQDNKTKKKISAEATIRDLS